MKKGDNSLSDAHSKLIALLGVKVAAYEKLVLLQSSYVENVEDDALSQDDLKVFKMKHKIYNDTF